MNKSKMINSEKDITESMINKWDEMIRYERERKPEKVLDFDLNVEGVYHEGVRDKEFNSYIRLGVKTSRSREYVKGKLITLEGIKELREIRNFYGRLKYTLGLEEDVRITVNKIKISKEGGI